MKTQLSPHDWTLLSSYLDGQLPARQKKHLDERLSTSVDLRLGLEELRQMRQVLRSTPRRKVPHHFTLTHAMFAENAPRPNLWRPVFSISSLVSLLMLTCLFMSKFVPLGASAPRMDAPQMQVVEKVVEAQPTAEIIQWGVSPGQGGGGSEVDGKGGAGPLSMQVDSPQDFAATMAPEPQVTESLPSDQTLTFAEKSMDMTATLEPIVTPTVVVDLEKPPARVGESGNEPTVGPLILGIPPMEEQGILMKTEQPASTPLPLRKLPSLTIIEVALLLVTLSTGLAALLVGRKRS
jgi:hypothetical protein